VKLRALLVCAGLLAPVGCTATTGVSGGPLPFKVAVIPFEAAALADPAEGSAPEGDAIAPRFAFGLGSFSAFLAGFSRASTAVESREICHTI
jgi:hypothetical protein